MWCAVDNHNYMCHICAKGFSQSLFQYHIKSNIHLHQNIQKITIQDRHDIGEIAKGQIGLKWLSPLELIQIKLTSTKQIRLKQK